MITAEYVMTWGKYEGKMLKDIPDSYLTFLYENTKRFNLTMDMVDYIVENVISKPTPQDWSPAYPMLGE